MWGKIWDSFECSNLFWRKVDVVIFAGAEKEAGVAVDSCVVVAAQSKTVLEGDALCRAGGDRKDGQNGESGEGFENGQSAMGERKRHRFRIQWAMNIGQKIGAND